MTPEQEIALISSVAVLSERVDEQERHIERMESDLAEINRNVQTITDVITTAKGFKGAISLIFMILAGMAVAMWEVGKVFFSGNGH